jgi:hypothetical protein
LGVSLFLDLNHLFLINPKGGVEDVKSMKDAGFGMIFCNVLDFHPDDWQLVRDRAASLGVVCGPWMRPVDASFSFAREKFHRLVEIADEWDAPSIVNLEKELDGTGDEITGYVSDYMGDRDYAVSMEAWPFAATDWTPFKHAPVLPQIFPQEVEAANRPDDCRKQWWKVGVECCVFTFGTYWGQLPDTFDLLSPYGLYPADSVVFSQWSPEGDHQPCAKQPDPEVPTMPPVDATQARESVCFSAQAWEQTQHDYTPKARLTICRRIAQTANDDKTWNSIRDSILAILDNAGLPK